jgi:pilus assembly protein CpaC
MKSKAALVIKLLMIVSLTILSPVLQSGAKGELAAAQPDSQEPAPLTSGAQGTLRVYQGKSFVLNTTEIIKRVSVTNDEVATAIVISPTQILIHGLKPGIISLLLWNEQEQVQAFDLQVLAVPMNLDPLRNTLSTVLPGEEIHIRQSGSAIVLTGTVSSDAAAEQAAAVAKTSADSVVSLLEVTQPVKQVVMLEVKFAEVQRNAAQQLGVNIFSTGALNTPGMISTQQFGPPTANNLSSSIGAPLTGFNTELEFTDVLNIFAFRPDLNLGLMIRALEQKSLLQTLAEPNLLALGGKEASFLAGGEFPVPIIQGTSGTPTVSVAFKEFGIRLKFVATPNPDGTILLHVAPEVSALDFANAVTLSGFLIPALTTRRAETELELKDGQSFALAGLLDNRVTNIKDKVPWLGDVPILGKLFQSKNFSTGKTELLVMVTPHIVTPLEPGQTSPLPSFPLPFMDSGAFDGKTGEIPAAHLPHSGK